MEENKLQINEKLFSFEGIIGRHGYFLNIVIISALSALITLPYTGYIYTHIGTFTDLLNIQKMFFNAPILLKLWVFFGTAIVCLLTVSNIFRRLNDIFGDSKTGRNVAFCTINVLASFSFLMPLFIGIIFSSLYFVLNIVLLFTRGKITQTLPYDYKKEFNWGAFFGTWIWGLFNKSYIPLWMLLLWITPLSFYFQLYCGLKGNEWAFKNKQCTDVKEFNKSQENQTLIFTILALVILPVLYFVIISVSLFILAYSAFRADISMHPEQGQSEHSYKDIRKTTWLKKEVSTIRQVTQIMEALEDKCELSSEGLAQCFENRMASQGRTGNILKLPDNAIFTFEGNGICKKEGDCKISIDLGYQPNEVVDIPLYVNDKGILYVKQSDTGKYISK